MVRWIILAAVCIGAALIMFGGVLVVGVIVGWMIDFADWRKHND